uniref:UDP N-acetylglucosamine O-acyltransferase C-terminal domain-containing protein n=1 Tax=Peronospora matthiolae TaxID=2874970 RepID=A0AAV1VIQ9_9STRA
MLKWPRLVASVLTPSTSCALSSVSAEVLDELVGHASEPTVRRSARQFDVFSRPLPIERRVERVPDIHGTAVVHPHAEVGPNVVVGPYSVVGPGVVLQDGVRLQSHVVIDGKTRVGRGTVVYPFASLGGEPQDKKHDLDFAAAAAEAAHQVNDWTLTIGRNCVIRERVTVHGSTSYSHCPTTIGDDCWLLCGAHVAHDSQLKTRVVVSNNVCIAGHVAIGDGAVIGGQGGLKQHVTVGPLAMVGGQSAVDGDVLPYGLVMGNRAKLVGLNLVGLRRAGVPRSQIKLLLQVYRYIFRRGCGNTGFAPALDLTYRGTVVERAVEAKQFLIREGMDSRQIPMVHEMVDFVVTSSQRFRSSLCHAAIATRSC